MINCGHCKGVHATVNAVYVCSVQEAEMIAEAKAQAEIEAFEAYCDEQDALAEWRAENPVGLYREPDWEALEANGGLDECPHGLSQWLCADPINHYPADNIMDCF